MAKSESDPRTREVWRFNVRAFLAQAVINEFSHTVLISRGIPCE